MSSRYKSVLNSWLHLADVVQFVEPNINHGPIITSRTALPDLFVGDGPALCTVPDLRPGHSRQLSSILRNVGLRDIPAVLPPHKLLDPCSMVALVHIALREDLATPIGSVYET